MKVLVFAHRLEMGGTQANAIDLAAALRDRHGFRIVFHASPGPMQARLLAKGIPLVPAPDVRLHPSVARVRVLRDLVRRERPDLIYAWDWWQGIEACCAVHLPMQIPLIISDMSMTLNQLLPRQIPTTFGVPAVQRQAAQDGWLRGVVLRPPVDLAENAPDGPDRAACRLALGLSDGDIALVSVSHLSDRITVDSLAATIDCVRLLGRQMPLRLVIVGDGTARTGLQHRATRANRELGRIAVRLPGAMSDPRSAYVAADIVIGMRRAALCGMAFARPVIVTGDNGFSRIFDPGTAAWFNEAGLQGSGARGGLAAMMSAITTLAEQPALRGELGMFGRSHVMQHHDLDKTSDALAGLCHAVRNAPTPPFFQDAARSAVIYLQERRFRTSLRDRPTGAGP